MKALQLRFVLAFAAAVFVARGASASFLTCSDTVSVHEGSFQSSVAVDAFPAPLTYHLTVTEAFCSWCATQPGNWCNTICPGGGASLVLAEKDDVLASILGQPIAWNTPNPEWSTTPPFWLFNGQSITTTVPLTLWSYADCATRARNVPAPYGPILPDASGRVVIPDTYRVEWNLDGVPPYYAECSAEVACLPPLGPTRTIGYFKTHPAAVDACLAAGSIDLGFLTVASSSTALGVLWANPAKYDDGTKRSSLDQARVLLGRQLLAAVCNGRVFGSTPADSELLAAARNVLAGTTCDNVSWLTGQLDAFNNSGDTGENTFGNAAPGTYPDPTPRTGYRCP